MRDGAYEEKLGALSAGSRPKGRGMKIREAHYLHSLSSLLVFLVAATFVACSADTLSEAEACRLASAQVGDVEPLRPTVVKVDLLPCSKFESRSAQGVADISVDAVRHFRNGQFVQLNFRCHLVRLDQGWRVDICSF